MSYSLQRLIDSREGGSEYCDSECAADGWNRSMGSLVESRSSLLQLQVLRK